MERQEICTRQMVRLLLLQQQPQLADTRGAELRARAGFCRALAGGWQPQ